MIVKLLHNQLLQYTAYCRYYIIVFLTKCEVVCLQVGAILLFGVVNELPGVICSSAVHCFCTVMCALCFGIMIAAKLLFALQY